MTRSESRLFIQRSPQEQGVGTAPGKRNTCRYKSAEGSPGGGPRPLLFWLLRTAYFALETREAREAAILGLLQAAQFALRRSPAVGRSQVEFFHSFELLLIST